MAYMSPRWFAVLGLLAVFGALAAGCSFSVTEVTRGEVERELEDRFESQGVAFRDVRCTSQDENMEDCLVSGSSELGRWWCAGFIGDELIARQGRCNPSNAQLRLQEYEEFKEQLERGDVNPEPRSSR